MERKAPAFTRLLKEWVKKSFDNIYWFFKRVYIRFYFFTEKGVISIIPVNAKPVKKQNNDLVNEQIPFKELLVISNTGEQLGVMSKTDALNKAYELDLDLLVVAPNAKTPVAKILDYNKFKFDQQKKEKENKKNQKVVQTKEIRLSVTIQTHDLETKAKACRKFLQDGDKVKISVRLMGRLAGRPELGKAIIDEMLKMVGDACKIDVPSKQEGKNLFMVIAPNIEK